MPKGDKLKLKADTEDGYTPIANLLLDAISIANLNGTEKGLIIYLWRNTYGQLVDGKRPKEAPIHQDAVAENMGLTRKHIYTCLKNLTNSKILLRKDLGQGRGYVYSMNTNIATWNSGTIDHVALKKLTKIDQNNKGSQIELPLNNTTPPVQEYAPSTKLLPATNTTTPSGFEAKNEPTTLVQKVTGNVTKSTHPTLYKESIKESIKEIKDEAPINEGLPVEENSVKGLSPKEIENENTKLIFTFLKERRGVPSPMPGGEASAIHWMLRQGFTVQEIKDTYDKLKDQTFWADKLLPMPTLKNQIADFLKKGISGKTNNKGAQSGQFKEYHPGHKSDGTGSQGESDLDDWKEHLH